MTREQLILKLIEADGAILYWQLPKAVVESAITDGLCRIDNNDLLVHRDAVDNGDGSYTMPEHN